jgi:hypothetical protein
LKDTVLQHAMELPISQMVVYGLGRCSKSGDSLIQLEFCALLLSRLPAAQSQAFVYDPQMSAGDYKMAAEFGFQRITENECGRRSVVRRPTLFFMPRCPLGLYDNLLEANYTANSLNNCLIVGNDFQSYTIRHSRSKLNRLAPYLAASVDLAHIERLKISDADDKDIQMSLNDLAIHRWTLPSSCSGTEFQLPAVDNAVKERDNELLGDPQH